MEPQAQGLLERQALHEADEEVVTDVDFTNMISEEEREELKAELDKLEDEIATLRQVLAAKEKHLVEIKQKLGINLMNELKQNFSKSWHDVQTTTAILNTSTGHLEEEKRVCIAAANNGNLFCFKVKKQHKRLKAEVQCKHSGPLHNKRYKKTQETLSQAGQKATAAISNVGTVISKKFGDMSYSIRHSISMPAMRNSPTFKSFEEKVETTVTSLKTKVGGATHSGGSFEDVLSSAAHASAQCSVVNTRLPETEEELQC